MKPKWKKVFNPDNDKEWIEVCEHCGQTTWLHTWENEQEACMEKEKIERIKRSIRELRKPVVKQLIFSSEFERVEK